MENEVKVVYPKKHAFFFRRWIDALCDLLDKMFFNFGHEKGETVRVSVWWSLIVGGITVVCIGIFVGKDRVFQDEQSIFLIAFSVIAVISAIYLFFNLRHFDSVVIKIVRAIYVFAVNIGAMFLGMFGIAFLVGIILISFILGTLFSLLFGGGGGAVGGLMSGSMFEAPDDPNSDRQVKNANHSYGDIIEYANQRYRHNGNTTNPWERI